MNEQRDSTLNPLKPLQDRLQMKGFSPLQELGRGNYGVVQLYQYNGDDASIIALCDSQKRVAVKLSSTPDQQEASIATYLQQKRAEGANFTADFNVTSPLADEQGLIGILSQYETYGTRIVNGEVQDCSDNLESFIGKASKPTDLNRLPDDVQRGMSQDTSIFLSQLASSMGESQHSFNQAGMFHRDIACRNYLVRANRDEQGNVLSLQAKLGDYGRTHIVPEGVTATYVQQQEAPLRWMDTEAVFNSITTVKTDLFATRVSMIGMLGMMADPGTKEIDGLAYDPKGDYLQERMARREKPTGGFKDNDFLDSDLLNAYLLQAKNKIDACEDPEKKAELKLFYYCYEDYLETMPRSRNVREALQEDSKMLQEAHNKFAQASFERLMKKAPNDDPSVLLSLQRLQQIPFNDETLRLGIEAAMKREQSKNLSPVQSTAPQVSPDAPGQSTSQAIYVGLDKGQDSAPRPPLQTELSQAPMNSSRPPIEDVVMQSDDTLTTPATSQTDWDQEANSESVQADSSANLKEKLEATPKTETDPFHTFKNKLSTIKAKVIDHVEKVQEVVSDIINKGPG